MQSDALEPDVFTFSDKRNELWNLWKYIFLAWLEALKQQWLLTFFFFYLIRLFLNSIFSDWYFCIVQDLLITSSCSLMRSACGPSSKATSMMLMWGQETTAAIKSWAEIRYRTYGRHFREENESRVARKNKRRGSAMSSHSKTLEGLTSLDQWWCFQGLWGHMWPWSQTRPVDEDAVLACGLFHHSEPGSAFPFPCFFSSWSLKQRKTKNLTKILWTKLCPPSVNNWNLSFGYKRKSHCHRQGL